MSRRLFAVTTRSSHSSSWPMSSVASIVCTISSGRSRKLANQGPPAGTKLAALLQRLSDRSARPAIYERDPVALVRRVRRFRMGF